MFLQQYKSNTHIVYESTDSHPPCCDVVNITVGEYVKDISGKVCEVLKVDRQKGLYKYNVVIECCFGMFSYSVSSKTMNIVYPLDFSKPLLVNLPQVRFTAKEASFMKLLMSSDNVLQAYVQVYGAIKTPSGKDLAYRRIAKILSHRDSKKYMERIKEILKAKGIDDEFFVSKMVATVGEDKDAPLKNEFQFEIMKLLATANGRETQILVGVPTQQTGNLLPMSSVESASYEEVPDVLTNVTPIEEMKL